MSQQGPEPAAAAKASSPINLLRKEMGFWDVMLFNIATVLGPRWIAAAAHNGTSSISLWVIAAVFFFVPTAMVVNELSSRFPEEGGLYVWAKEAFGDFHGFVAGWNYWIYTVFYFPGLLLASSAMSAYIIGENGVTLAQNRTFLLLVSLGLLLVAVILNVIGLNVGKWLQNAGGISTYAPLLILIGIASILWISRGSVTPFTRTNIWPVWNWDTVNFWSQIAFAFTGLELVSAMSAEIRDPRRTLPRAVYAAGVSIALLYILGTVSVLVLVPAPEVSPTSGVFHAITAGAIALKIGFVGILAAILVTVGNAGGVGSTVAGIARVPFVVGIDRYLPSAFGKIHPRWKTPYVAIIVQAVASGAILLISQISETARVDRERHRVRGHAPVDNRFTASARRFREPPAVLDQSGGLDAGRPCFGPDALLPRGAREKSGRGAGLINRPDSGRGELHEVVVRIPKIKAGSAARPANPALDCDSLFGEQLFPLG